MRGGSPRRAPGRDFAQSTTQSRRITSRWIDCKWRFSWSGLTPTDCYAITSTFTHLPRAKVAAQRCCPKIAAADALALPIRVSALRGSRSDDCYARPGFQRVEQAEFDKYYVRSFVNQMTLTPLFLTPLFLLNF